MGNVHIGFGFPTLLVFEPSYGTDHKMDACQDKVLKAVKQSGYQSTIVTSHRATILSRNRMEPVTEHSTQIILSTV